VDTADETAAARPACGVFSTRVKEYVSTRPRDLPQGRTRVNLVWRKRRWYCREPLRGRKSFTESVPAVPAGARITTRLREHAGELVVDGQCATVAAPGRLTGVSWPTVMDAARAVPVPVAPEPVVPEPVGPEPVARQRESARTRVLADRWHVGFTDIGGGQGMLGQIEGRTGDDVAYWLAMHTPAWRDRIRTSRSTCAPCSCPRSAATSRTPPSS
jgi:hypothetical protein